MPWFRIVRRAPALGGRSRSRWDAAPGLLLVACGPSIPPPVEQGAVESRPHERSDGAAPEAPSSASVGSPSEGDAPTSNCHGQPGTNLATGGKVTASDSGTSPNEAPDFAFDDHTGTKWSETANPTPWIAYEFAGGRSQVVTQYALSPAPEGTITTDPVSWKLEGSNDGTTWTTLHVEERFSFFNRQAMVWFSFENATAYRHHRFSVTENGGGSGVALAELQLFGPGTPTFSVDNAVFGTGLHQFQFGPGWEHGVADVEVLSKYGRSSSWSKKKNSILSFPFRGSRVRLYGVRHPQHGIAAFSIDGGPETLADFYGETAGNVLFYSSPELCPRREHVLRVRTTGEKHEKSKDVYISIDRVQVVP